MSKFTQLLIFFFLSGYAVSQELQTPTANENKLSVWFTEISIHKVEHDELAYELTEGSGGFVYAPPFIEMTLSCETEELVYLFYIGNMGQEGINVTAFFQSFELNALTENEIFSVYLLPGDNYTVYHSVSFLNPIPPGIYEGQIIFVTDEPGLPQYIIPTSHTIFGGVQPIAEFTADQAYIFENDTVTFTDLSENNPVSWQWTFLGGIPGSSTKQNPQVVYPYYGTYNVQLKVTNECGQDILFKSEYIHVDFASGDRQPVPVSGIKVFPNPSEGVFYVDVPGEQQFLYKVLELSGRVVIESEWTTNRLIDLRDKSPSLYFLEIIMQDGTVEQEKRIMVR